MSPEEQRLEQQELEPDPRIRQEIELARVFVETGTTAKNAKSGEISSAKTRSVREIPQRTS
jgi:hypothetical protein